MEERIKCSYCRKEGHLENDCYFFEKKAEWKNQ